MTTARSAAWMAMAAFALVGVGAALRARTPSVSSPPVTLADGARLLWWEGRTVQNVGDSAVVVHRDGRVFTIDRLLHAHRRATGTPDQAWRQATFDAKANLWLTDSHGALVRIDPSGQHHRVPSTELSPPTPVVGTTGPLVWLTRSTDQLAGGVSAEPGPLLIAVDAEGTVRQRVGRAHRPAHALLEAMANAGQLVVVDSLLYFAPFIRDQLVAMHLAGDTVWVASRGLLHSSGEPAFEVQDGRVVVNYHPVNLGLAKGPDGRLYLLSTSDGAMSSARLDVFEPRTGALVQSYLQLPLTPTIAVDGRGRVQILASSVVLGTSDDDRRQMPSLQLPLLQGGRLNTDTLRGRVVLVNLWASWCAPCRTEMPALDSLQQEVGHGDVVFLSLNEDANAASARRFLDGGSYRFPVALGGAGLHERFGAPGLPATILMDRSGKELRRWVGYAGAEQITEIRTALAEAKRGAAAGADPGTADQHQHHQHQHQQP